MSDSHSKDEFTKAMNDKITELYKISKENK